MKANKIIAGMLVMLGFAACEPEPEDPPQSIASYGVPSAQFEQKPAVPVNETVEFVLPEIEESNEPTTRREQ